MDRTVQRIQDSLITPRTRVASHFQQLAQPESSAHFARFLVTYCRQASLMSSWLCDWSRALQKEALEINHTDMATALAPIESALSERQAALEQDWPRITKWFIAHLDIECDALDAKISPTVGMKQLRNIFQTCLKRHDFETWLLIANEIERIRIIHGFTLIKLCEVLFGSSVLRCLSHVILQHKRDNATFVHSQAVIKLFSGLQTDHVPFMIASVSQALSAYTQYIEDCYQLSLKKALYVK